ncbi:hypothetical protein [Arsenophonus sp.]|uniref:hypothetical protein n=1 Tax=Arsenophonus sp. TaxID=1872640 RepID=UPI00387A3CEE
MSCFYFLITTAYPELRLKYYITHDLDTDELLSDENGDRADALKRVLIAPFFFTDRLSEQQTTEGKTYQWPNLDLAAYTAMLKQQPLAKKPPLRGIYSSSLKMLDFP